MKKSSSRLAKQLDDRRRDEVHAALTELYSQGGALAKAPRELTDFFTEVRLAQTAKDILKSTEVLSRGKAVIVTAGPPGAGKSSALDQLFLDGYRRIDPDEIKDVLLDEADRRGLLGYRRRLSLPDEGGYVHQRELSSQVHYYSTVVADLMRLTALSRGENVIIDGSLSWAPLAQQYVGELLEAGYQSATVISVEAPEEIVVMRARERWWTDRKRGEPGGRFVPEEVVRAPFAGEYSSCSRNAVELVEKARDELGAGELIQYRFDPSTGKTIQIRSS